MTKAYSRFFIVVSLIIVVTVLVAAPFVTRRVSANLTRNGLSYARSRDYSGAERLFRKAIRWDARNSEAYVQLAIALIIQNRFDAAYDVLRNAENRFKASDKNYLRIKSEKGRVARYLGKGEESEALLKFVLEARPEDGLAHFRLGHIYYDRGEFQKAKAEYEAAVRAGPRSARFRSALAAVLIKLGNNEEAEKELRSAIRFDPLFPNAYNNLAVIYQKRGQYTVALPYVEYAIRLNPQRPEYRMTKAEIYEASGNIKMAIEAYREAAELLKSSPPIAQSLRDSVETKLNFLGGLQTL